LSTANGLYYLFRNLSLVAAFWYLASHIDPLAKSSTVRATLGGSYLGAETVRWALWGTYWWYQGLTMTGLWVIGHEVRRIS
jgi:omega-6 fatty acid desaturase (delta-12 desaturase)